MFYNPKKTTRFVYKKDRILKNMEDIDIKIENTSKSSCEDSSDISREQEKWTPKLENFIDALAHECNESFLYNQKARLILEFRSNILNGLSLSMPIIAACINEIPIIEKSYRIIPSILMLSASGLVGITRLLEYEKKSQRHNEFSGKYRNLEGRIRYTLSRSRKNRIAADVRVQEFIHEHDVLVSSAP